MLLLPIFLCAGFTNPEAGNESYNKAMFIYTFVKYIHWPEDVLGDVFTIGVIGKTETISELKSICENKTANDKPIQIIQINETEKVSDCEAIFITKSQSFLLGDILDLIDKRGTLVVTEAKGMLKNGSAINLVKEGQKDAFEVDINKLTQQGLKIPDNLLVLAVNINLGPRF